MDNRPIGVFDSGVGGLAAVKELHKILPNEDILYFGDTGRVPYGTRSRRTIVKYAAQDVQYLLGQNVKLVMAACGTVSSNVSPGEVDAWGLQVPYIGVVTHAAREACRVSEGRIGVIATAASVRSEAFPSAIAEINPRMQVFQNACPLFVPLVENGMTQADNPITRLCAEMYLEPLLRAEIDTLILGCTHYPLLAPLLGDILGEKVRLIDTGAVAAAHVRSLLEKAGAFSAKQEAGVTRYFVTDTVENFVRVAQNFLQEDVERDTEFVDIDTIFPA